MSDRQSRAEQFYQELTGHSDPVAFLHGLVSQGKAEDEYLEFKGASRIADKDAKQYWSQALSGFANTEGGVLIWGIRAARINSPTDPSRTVDAASGLDLVPHPETFLQMLKDVRLEASVDPVQGVKCGHYDAGNGDGSGFVVCLIPEGENKPYRAAIDPAKQYYQRIGDSFVIIPHSMLRSLFYPHGSPALAVDVKVEHIQNSAKFSLSIINVGNATARELCLVERNRTIAWVSIWSPIRGAGNDIAGIVCNTPLHPGQSIALGAFQVPRQNTYRQWNPVTFQFTAYTDDHPPQAFWIQYDEDAISCSRCGRFPATTEAI